MIFDILSFIYSCSLVLIFVNSILKICCLSLYECAYEVFKVVPTKQSNFLCRNIGKKSGLPYVACDREEYWTVLSLYTEAKLAESNVYYAVCCKNKSNLCTVSEYHI